MYIGSDTIHIWVAFVPDLMCEKNYPHSQMKKASSFKNNRILAHRVIHAILLLYNSPLNQGNTESSYFKMRNGKPALLNNKVEISIAHSFDYILVGITVDSEIGIDIEKSRNGKDFEMIAGRVFSNQEIELYISRNKANDKPSSFYQSWTRQESYFKALGSGIKLDWSTKNQSTQIGPINRWSMHSFRITSKKYIFSISTQCHIKKIRRYYFTL